MKMMDRMMTPVCDSLRTRLGEKLLFNLLTVGLSISIDSVECMSSKPLISNVDNIFKDDVDTPKLGVLAPVICYTFSHIWSVHL